MTTIEKNVYDIVNPIIEKIGYNVYDIIYEKEGKDNYLRIFIDNEKGIDLNDCEKVNDAINDILDEKDPIKNQYMLEVSSPGIERRLRSNEHLKKAIDKKIEIHTFEKVENQKVLIGILKSYDEDSIVIVPVENMESNNKNKKAKKMKKTEDSNNYINEQEPNKNRTTIESQENDKSIKISRKNISTMKIVFDW